MNIGLLEILILAAGIVFGYIYGDKLNRMQLLGAGLVSGLLITVIFGIIQGLSLYYFALQAIVISALVIVCIFIGSFLMKN